MEFRRLPGTHPDALALANAMVDELLEIYTAQPGAPTATGEELSPPGGGFVVLYEDGPRGRPAAASSASTEGVGEIKRMYVAPEARSRGHARRLLGELEALARDLGYERVRLDTGAEQPHARALYASAGYLEIDDYNRNPYATYWGEKRL